jgi:hypothetical protein
MVRNEPSAPLTMSTRLEGSSPKRIATGVDGGKPLPPIPNSRPASTSLRSSWSVGS